MPAVFQTSPIGAGGESHVTVIHCADPRYQPHFQEFLRSHLDLEHYALIAVPGGAQWMTLVDYLPKFSWAGWRFVKFVRQVARTDRIILIAHAECRWYEDMRFGIAPSRLREQQIDDLRRVRRTLLERFAPLTVECYYAAFQAESVSFEVIS
jgi:hypothetical protein